MRMPQSPPIGRHKKPRHEGGVGIEPTQIVEGNYRIFSVRSLGYPCCYPESFFHLKVRSFAKDS